MKFGYMVSAQYPPGTDVSQEIPKLVEQVQAVRELGFNSIWVLQHYLGNLPTLQPIPLLARLAEAAGPLTLGTNIIILPLHHPVQVAEEMATLDHITGGNTILGVGMGYRQNEFDAFGVPLSQRVGRFREAIQVIRGLWTGKPFSFEGRYFQVKEQTIGLPPVQPGGPPIWIGAAMEKAVLRAAEIGDAWIIPHDAKTKRVKGLLESYRQELKRLGKNLDRPYPLFRELCLHRDPAAAYAEGKHYVAIESQAYAQYGLPWLEERLEDLIQKAYLFCDPETCVQRLKELASFGITEVIVRCQWSGIPQDSVLRSLRLFAEEVMPHFAEK